MPLPGILVTLDSDGYASSRGQGGLVTPLRRLDAGDARKSAVVTTSTLQQLLGYARRNGHCAPVDPEYTSSGRLTGYAVLSTTPNASLLRGNCWDEVWTSALEKPLQSITLCPGFVIHEVQLAHPLDDVDYADLFEELSEFTDCTSHDDSSNTTSGPTTPLGESLYTVVRRSLSVVLCTLELRWSLQETQGPVRATSARDWMIHTTPHTTAAVIRTPSARCPCPWQDSPWTRRPAPIPPPLRAPPCPGLVAWANC